MADMDYFSNFPFSLTLFWHLTASFHNRINSHWTNSWSTFFSLIEYSVSLGNTSNYASKMYCKCYIWH